MSSTSQKISFCLIVFVFLISVTRASKIEFYGGEYRNLLVAINPKINDTNCQTVLEGLVNTLNSVSSRLNDATEGKASFGHIKILVPWTWKASSCNLLNFGAASATDLYNDADFKITNSHLIAKSVPWTRQYRSCGQSSDDIIIPLEFLLSNNSDYNIKANILLHEWAKLRYGVFEEHSYHGDDKYNPCYSEQNHLKFSSCSDVKLDTISNSTEMLCRSAISQNTDLLLSKLVQGKTSLMSLPQLSNVNKFCTDSTHNKMAATKQNLYCDRRSISDVIFSHPDFLAISGSNITIKQRVPTVEFIRHSTNAYPSGYAFVIEDSEDIRLQSRMRLIKQSIVQMVDLMDPITRLGIITFSGEIIKEPVFLTLANAEGKHQLIKRIPDSHAPSLVSKLSPKMAKQALRPNNLYFALRETLDKLNSQTSFKWNIILVTSSPSTSFQSARDIIHENSHALTVFTFDTNQAWLGFYTTSNTKNVLVLPQCSPNTISCQSLIASLAMDAFLDSLGSQDSPRALQKLTEVDLQKGGQTMFNISTTVSSVTNFHITMPIFSASNLSTVIFYSPSNVLCPGLNLLDYPYMIKMDTTNAGCHFQAGTWRLDFPSLTNTSDLHRLQVIVESSDSTSRLLIKATLGSSKSSQVFPNSQLIPVFARLTNYDDVPVVAAQVEMMLLATETASLINTMVLLDNGIDPDVIRNDGVYSAYIQSYSTEPSYHNAKLTILTISSVTKAIGSLSSEIEYSAAMLDDTMNSKCCGSFIPIGTNSSVGNSKYSSLVPGFRTAEIFNPALLPPSKIDYLKVSSDDGTVLVLEFTAPGSALNFGILKYYENCCTFVHPNSSIEEYACHPISPQTNCIPVESGQIQNCRIDRGAISRDFIGTVSSTTQEITVFLYCGIRGVNSKFVAGKVSNNLIEIEIKIAPIDLTNGTKTLTNCNSISDDCLPILVFWGLIGCICGLVLVIFALIICWCVTFKKNKSHRTNIRQEILMGTNHRSRTETPKLPDKDSPLYNVYVNKAYIQESDGHMKLVAADGELIPLDSNDHHPIVQPESSFSQPPIPSVRRQSVSATEINHHENQSQPSWKNAPSERDDTKIYKSHLSNKSKPEPPPKPYFNANNNNNTLFKPKREENVVPVAKNRLSKTDLGGYANSFKNNTSDNSRNNMERIPVTTISAGVQEIEIPVYASVNRNGRRPLSGNTNQPLASLIKQGGTSTFVRPNQSEGDSSSVTGLLPNRFNTSRPSSGYQSEHNPSLPRSRPPSRLDAFPSSDSDTYSDMSRGIPMAPKPPPVPPPFPNNNNGPIQGRNSQPRTGSRNPLKGNMNAPAPPPPVPPKYIQPPPPPKNLQSEHYSDNEYDEDSEHWDDDDFDFNPGVSYA